MNMLFIIGDVWVAMATILAVIITGGITIWQVKKSNDAALKRLETQHRNTIDKMYAETQVLKKRKYNDQTLEALQKCWGLLVYTTNNENEKSIISYIDEKDDSNQKKRVYFFNKANIDEYIRALRSTFYVNGWGLYLTSELKRHLFDYERLVWKLKSAGQNNPENIERILKNKLVEEMYDLHQKLLATIRKNMNDIYN